MRRKILARPEPGTGLRQPATLDTADSPSGDNHPAGRCGSGESPEPAKEFAGLVYACRCVFGLAVTTWTLGACAAVADAAEPARIDPAALSASIAGTIMDRLTDMTPPRRRQRSAACCMTPTARTARLNYLGNSRV
jgi:hypothetical protein